MGYHRLLSLLYRRGDDNDSLRLLYAYWHRGGGHPIPYDTDMGEWEAAWIYLLGTHPPISRSGMVRYTWFVDHFKGTAPVTREETEQYARGFLMFVFGTTLFADRANTVGLYLMSALVDLSRV